MKSVFITRDLSENSVFRQKLEGHGYKVFHSSLLQFTPISFEYNFATDWVFFYSKNAVKFFFQKTFQENFKKVKFGTIGAGTASYLKDLGFEVHFIGNGHPKITATSFLAIAENKKVLFPRASNSKQSIQKFLRGKIKEIDLVVNENQPKPKVKIPETDIVVFTSPMSAEVYFKKTQSTDNQKFVAIGTTTAAAIKTSGIQDFVVSKNPSEADLVKAVLSITFG